MESSIDLVLKHAPQWKAVARDLGFSDNRVERIKSDYIPRAREMLARHHLEASGCIIISGRAMTRFLDQVCIT